MRKLTLCVLVGLAVVTVASPALANLAISTSPSEWLPLYELGGSEPSVGQTARCKLWVSQPGKLTVLVQLSQNLKPAPVGFEHLGNHIQIDLASGVAAPVYTVIVATSGARVARADAVGPSYLANDAVSCIIRSDQSGHFYETTIDLTPLGIVFTGDSYILMDVAAVSSDYVMTLSTNPPAYNTSKFVTVRQVIPYKTLSELFSDGIGAKGITRLVVVHSEDGWGYLEDPIHFMGTRYTYTGDKLTECSYITAEVTVSDWKSLQITNVIKVIPFTYPKRVEMHTGLMRQSIANAADPTGLYTQVIARVTGNVMNDGSGPVLIIGQIPDGLFKMTGVVGNGVFYVKSYELL